MKSSLCTIYLNPFLEGVGGEVPPPPPMIFTKTVMDARLSGRFALVFILSFDCGSVRVQIKTKIKTNLFEGLFINLKIFKILRKSKFFEIIFLL